MDLVQRPAAPRSTGGRAASRRSPARARLVSAEALPPDLDPTASPGVFLARLFAVEPERWLRRMPGRETFVWPGGHAVAKRFAAPARWPLARRTSPAWRELETLCALGAAGISVPAPIGAWEDPPRGARARRSGLLMERVEHEGSVRERIARNPPSAGRWTRAAAELAARLHAAGWHHRDLYLQHLLVARGRLVLLDVGRARRPRLLRARWRVKDVAALASSFPPAAPASARLRLVARYLDLRGVGGRRARRRFAAAVLRKARRYAAHRPRHVDPRAEGELW